jgi:magnesium-transporting ATPase (P-type)
VVVVATGNETELGRINALLAGVSALVPRLAKIAIWLVLIAVACGLVLYLAVWTNLIQ